MLRYYRDIKATKCKMRVRWQEKFEIREIRTVCKKKHKACIDYQINYSLDQYPGEGPEIDDDDGCEFGYSMAV
jgi:hypothetical protein